MWAGPARVDALAERVLLDVEWPLAVHHRRVVHLEAWNATSDQFVATLARNVSLPLHESTLQCVLSLSSCVCL